MKKSSVTLFTSVLSAVLLLSITGCGSDSSMAGEVAPPPSNQAPLIEEPDLYRWLGNHLYVQNPQTGLNILDVTIPSQPKLVGRAAVTGAAGAEMYIRNNNQAIILLKSASGQCKSPDKLNPAGWSFGAEVVFVNTAQKTHPKVMERYCIPGSLVASRTVDDILYLVTTSSDRGSRAVSVNIADPLHVSLVQQMDFHNASKEIFVNPEAIFVAGEEPSNPGFTRVSYISINPLGKMKARGTFDVPGSPQGRFHMHVKAEQFRIVTYEKKVRKSRLSILDISDPDHLSIIGELPNIGAGEQLKATRFDGDKAYVVTFRRTDPLWVISLSDPTRPRIVGELHVPGWSDFLFPRGDKLVAVGRGDNGRYLGVSLFDVSDPHNPRALDQKSLGNANSTSEANVDHRGVTILEPPTGYPIIMVPHTVVSYNSSCEIRDRLQLVEIKQTSLRVRGVVEQKGAIRRSLMLKSNVYSISDYEVISVSIKDLDAPKVETAVTVGVDPNQGRDYSSHCYYYGNERWIVEDDVSSGPFPFFCSLGSAAGAPIPPLSVMLGLLCLVFRLRRSR